MYNAADRKDIRRAEKEAKLAEQQRREFMSGIMSTIPGRKWLHEKLVDCHIFSTSFNRDSLAMAFAEGQRDIGLKLLNDIMASCPDEYILMMREENERHSASERSRSQNNNGRNQGPESFDTVLDSIFDSNGDAEGDEVR